MPVHIRARRGDIARAVLAVGDPGRARRLSRLLDNPRLVNEYRCLLVYTGEWRGEPVTIATHGVGAGSASIVFEELIQLGAERIVRLGTAGGVRKDLKPGAVVVADSASAFPGGCGLAQYAPGMVPALAPDTRLTVKLYEELRAGGFDPLLGTVHCSDAFYAEDPGLGERLGRLGVTAIEMEAASLFLISRIRGVRAGAVFIVSNVIGSREFLGDEELGRRVDGVAPIILDVLIRG